MKMRTKTNRARSFLVNPRIFRVIDEVRSSGGSLLDLRTKLFEAHKLEKSRKARKRFGVVVLEARIKRLEESIYKLAATVKAMGVVAIAREKMLLKEIGKKKR